MVFTHFKYTLYITMVFLCSSSPMAAMERREEIRFPASDSEFIKGASSGVAWTGMPLRPILREGVEWKEGDPVTAKTHTFTKLADERIPHYMSGKIDEKNPFGLEPRNIRYNAENLLPSHPLRAASWNFEGVNWDEPIGETVPQTIADLMATHLAIYAPYFLKRIGMTPLSNGPDISRWDGETAEFINNVGDASQKYFEKEGIAPYHPEAGKWGWHPFATQEDSTGCKGAAEYLKSKELTLRHLLRVNFADGPVLTPIDPTVNLPFTENPYADRIGVSGNSFYFLPGENAAVDMFLGVQDIEGQRWYFMMERMSDTLKTSDGKPMIDPRLEDGSPARLSFFGGMMEKYTLTPKLARMDLCKEGGLLLNMDKILHDKFGGAPMMPAYASGFVAAEARQTSTSGTVTQLSYILFKGWEDLKASTTLGDILATGESARAFFVREDLLIARLAAALKMATPKVGENPMPVSTFFASHGPMLKTFFDSQGVSLEKVKYAPAWEEAHLTPAQIKVLAQ